MEQRPKCRWKLGFLILVLAVFILTFSLKNYSMFKWNNSDKYMEIKIQSKVQPSREGKSMKIPHFNSSLKKVQHPPEGKSIKIPNFSSSLNKVQHPHEGKSIKIPHFNSSLNLEKSKRSYRVAWYKQDPEIQKSVSKYDPKKCNISNCVIEENSSLADIVVLRHSFLPFHPVIQKRKGQLWVLYSSESPHHTLSPPRDWADQIDLSASYMESSDFFVPLYGRVELRKVSTQRNLTGILANKTKDAVWVSSHCTTPGKRENLVKALSKYLKVDIFGACGPNKCGKQYDDIKECEATFVNNYKFYFAFENSICDNYTTEKLYFLFRDASAIIPVTNGPRDVDKYVPKNTYINSFDYDSPKLLAEKLKEIGNNETEYIRFLKEKEKYTMPRQSVNDLIDVAIHKFQCDMCRYLYDLDIGQRSKKPKTWQHVFDPLIQCIPGI